jgi:hypothetical protein
MSRYQIARRNHDVKEGNKCTYLGNDSDKSERIHEEIKSRLN